MRIQGAEADSGVGRLGAAWGDGEIGLCDQKSSCREVVGRCSW